MMNTSQTIGSDPEPLHLVFLGPHDAVGGAVPRIVRQLKAGLTERGWRVTTRYWGARTSSEGLAQKAVSRSRDAVRLASEISSDAPDVVVIHSGMDWKTVPRDLLLCTRLRRRVPLIVLQPHGGHADWVGDDRPTPFRGLSRDLLKLVDGVFVLSWEEAHLYARGEPTVTVRRVTNPFGPVEPPRRAERSQGATRLLFVGRMVETKGVLDAIAAMSLISPNVTLSIAGDGPLLSRAGELVSSLGLGHRVSLLGHVQGAALRTLYETSDVLVLPTYFAEGFPTVLAEAMAAGLGIITTQVRGARDYLADEANCLFVTPRRPRDLAAAVRRIHEQPLLLQRMIENNHVVVEGFSPDRVCDEYEESLLAVRRSAIP
jgi:glycosyltransferase involved in cell wall biosynthesis